MLGPRAGRGVVTRAEHVADAMPSRARDPRRADRAARGRRCPSAGPAACCDRLRSAPSTSFASARAPRVERGSLESLGAHMFPLDALDAWPRLYGRGGFVQYQLVVPPATEDALGR